MTADAPRIVVMGPSGSGKSVVGPALALRRGIPFVDDDRMPWLDVVAETLECAPAGMAVAWEPLELDEPGASWTQKARSTR
jgi:gluconokinase